MVKDKNCPKNNKDKKKMTAQIYVAREDESEESEPYGGSQYSLEGEEVGFENESQEEEEVWMHMYRMEEYEEDFEEIEELDEEDQLMEENSDDEGIAEDSRSDSEDCEDDDPIQEFPTGESEIEGTEESEPYKTKNKIVYESQVLFSALKEGRELPSQNEKDRTVKNTTTVMKKSSRMLERPIRTKEETKTFIIMVKINGQEVIALLDSGCTTEAISVEMVQIVGLKVHQLTEQIPIQLGTKGSKSWINHGTKVCIKIGTVDNYHYFNIININRYDIIIGTVFHNSQWI